MGSGSINAWSFGSGPAVLLVHGWEGHAGQLSAFVRPIVERGFRAVIFDLPAHGASSGESTNVFEVADAIEAIGAVVGEVQAVVAHSLGGTATALAVSRGFKAKAIALIAPAAEPTTFANKLADLLGFDEAQRAGMIAAVEARVGERLDRMHVADRVGQAPMPALLVHDPADPEVPIAHAESIARAWPGARLERVTGLGHQKILRAPAVVDRVVGFIAPE
jgi:pimeloyl-ACP methyl ester carboxylesterase